MNKQVYFYFLRTYGKGVGYWFGVFTEVVRSFLHRVFSNIIAAKIATFIAAGDINSAKQYAIYFLLAHVGATVIGAIGDLVAIWSQNEKYNEVRNQFYEKLISKDLSFYRDRQTGYLTASFRQFLDGLMNLGRILRLRVTKTLVSIIVPVVILWLNDWRLGLAAIGIVLIQIIYMFWSSAKSNKYRAMSHEIYRKLTGEVADEITNIVAFKSSGMEEEGRDKVNKLGDQETAAFWLRHKTNVLLDAPRNIITAIGITIGVFIALQTASSDPESIGLSVLIIFFLFQISRNLGELPTLLMDLDDRITQVYPVLEYLEDKDQTIKDPISPKKLKIKNAELELKNVNFSYNSKSKKQRVTVFKDFNLRIEGGQQVGIVGLSGAGKSTLASLIMRFDDVEGDGKIAIDGVNIKDVKQSDLRQSIAYVPQEPLLFHKTIRENIAYFLKNAKDQDIIKAAKAAHAHEFISELPDGYDTIVGERGIKLSGGQKQRIVIARTILKNAPIMIFDEATSALDSESEQIIQKAMPGIMGKHTAIVIAHRLSTVANLDKIFVLEKGKVVEEGTHHQLLLKKGRYYKLWHKQIGE